MKTFTLILALLYSIVSYSQPQLGSTKADILVTYNSKESLISLEEGVNTSGVRYVTYKSKTTGNDYIHFFDDDGYCHAYMIMGSYDNLNLFMSVFNDKLVKTGEDTWVNYGKVNTYWKLIKEDDYFYLHATLEP